METVLAALAFLLLLAGLIGAIIPVIPGPPLGYIGLLLLQWSGYGNFSLSFLLILAAITAVITIMDNFLPALLTKQFGGSRLAVIGSVLGLIAGVLFFAPIGLLVGSFLGAFLGEWLNNQLKINRKKAYNPDEQPQRVPESGDCGEASGGAGNIRALKAALGAFLAFIVSAGAKLIIGALMIYYAARAVL